MPETGGVTVKDVAAHDFVIAYAAHLKRIGKIEVPKWADLVKTGTAKELAPYDPDWYYIRAAAIARRVYLRGGIGVGAFKRIFGGRIHRGTRPEKFMTGSGSIARHILKEVRAIAPLQRRTTAHTGGGLVGSGTRRGRSGGDLSVLATPCLVVASPHPRAFALPFGFPSASAPAKAINTVCRLCGVPNVLQLETLKIVEKVPNAKGRRITPQGQRDLDSIAGQISK